jgi:ankyrin repeat protein
LRFGANPECKNPQGLTAFMMAACCDSSSSVTPVKVLLELGADPTATDSFGRTASDYAEFSGYTAIVEYLVAAGLHERNLGEVC